MNALIDDLLRLARSGNQVDDLESIDLPDLSERCWENVVTEDGSIVVETDRTIRGDRNRLQQLFENLFRNSMEHGSTSDRPQADDASDRVGEGVTITVGDLEDGFYVEDDGPGIPEETREKIFESGYSTKDAGTGFGLAIVEEIVEAHGWEITVAESDAGGARFEITGIDGTV
jgi:signal transduction histidine kinase